MKILTKYDVNILVFHSSEYPHLQPGWYYQIDEAGGILGDYEGPFESKQIALETAGGDIIWRGISPSTNRNCSIH